MRAPVTYWSPQSCRVGGAAWPDIPMAHDRLDEHG